jgi:NAD(P)-dependent dehydrogenase (short-subunit alcohol dehydrogenase family)
MNTIATITPSSVFVVSGGARGITAQCVLAMARRYRCRFLLLGRSARSVPEAAHFRPGTSEADLKREVAAHLVAQGQKPTPPQVQQLVRAIQATHEIDATLRAVAEVGGQAAYLDVDITNRDEVLRRLPPALEPLGPVSGIIHGAGNLADKLIEQKTLRDFERVYTVKVSGLANLLAALPLNNLAYLVLFSSVVGFYGNVGQTDYAIANEVLNKMAHQVRQKHPSCRVVAINWGPWDGGMVTPALKQYFAEQNITVIPQDAGTEMLLYELERPHSSPAQTIVGSGLNVGQAVQPAQNGELRTHRTRRRLVLEDNPFLYDHVIGGRPVLAAVFGVSWIANTCEQLYPGYTLHTFHDYRVLKGIVFDETLADSYLLDVKEIERSDEEIALDALIWSETPNGKQRYHYSGQIRLRREPVPPPTYATFDPTESHVLDGAELYRDGTLFHGPSFQGIERTLNISPQKVTMQCRVPELSLAQQGQFPIHTFHPYLTDIEFQCMLIWVRQYCQAGGMPLRAALIEHYRSLAPGERFYVSMDVQHSSDSSLVADVTVHDAEGLIYLRVSGTAVTISKRLNTLFAQSRIVVAAQPEQPEQRS